MALMMLLLTVLTLTHPLKVKIPEDRGRQQRRRACRSR
jgi:hypothetical protein